MSLEDIISRHISANLPKRYKALELDLITLFEGCNDVEFFFGDTVNPAYCYDVLELSRKEQDQIRRDYLLICSFLLGCWRNHFIQNEMAVLFDQSNKISSAIFCFHEARRLLHQEFKAQPSQHSRILFAFTYERESRFFLKHASFHEAFRSRIFYHALHPEDPVFLLLEEIVLESTDASLNISELMDGRVDLASLISLATEIEIPVREAVGTEIIDWRDRCNPWSSASPKISPATQQAIVNQTWVPTKISRIQNALVDTQYWTTAVFDSNGVLIKTHSCGPAEFYGLYIKMGVIELRRHLDGTTAMVTARHGWAEYYHWLICVLPCFGQLVSLGIKIDNVIAYGADTRSYCQEFFRRLHMDVAVFGEASSYHFEVDDLLVCNGTPQLSAEGVKFVRDIFSDGNAVERTRKLYVTRRKAQTRRLLNEDEVLRIVEEHGFEVVTTEDLSVSEQAKLFEESLVVLAPHGAGLSNCIFCQEGTAVIEIIAAENPVCYYNLCNALALEYHFVSGQMQGQDLIADVESLTCALDAVFQANSTMLDQSS